MISLNKSLNLLSISCRRLFQPSQNGLICVQSTGLKTSLEEKVGLPPKPKKPLTPYFRFMKNTRPSIISQNPKAKAHEIVKILATQWENLDENSKKKLQDEFKKDQINYLETRTNYESKITEEQRSQLKQLRQEIVEAREKKAMRRRIKELGKPKKPSSAFLNFLVKERIVTPQGPNQSYREWHKKTSEKWSRMSETEKAPYYADAKKDLDLYKKNLAKWEEKMIRLGHIDVVRQDSLIDPPGPKTKKVQKPKKSE